MLTIFVWAAVAAAQDPSGNVQLLHPSVDAQRSLWTDDAGPGEALTSPFLARGLLSFTSRPLLVREDDEVQAVVGSTWRLDLLGAATWGRLRLGANVPLLLAGRSDVLDSSFTGLGDLAVDGRLTLIEPGPGSLGIAVASRLTLPTTTVEAPLGGGGPSLEATGIADWRLEDLWLLVNAGVRVGPPTVLGELTIGPRLLTRAAAGIPVGQRVGVSADLAASFGFGVPASVGAPIEVLLGGWLEMGPTTLRAGIGRGFSSAVGAPAWRSLLSLSWAPPREREARVARAQATPASSREPELPVEDVDRDGVVDAVDACIDEPEDPDGYQDGDGCPEPVQLSVVVEDATGAVVHGAFTWLQCEGVEARLSASARAAVPPGTCSVNVAAPGWSFGARTFEVPNGLPQEQRIQLAPEGAIGYVRVTVRNGMGEPVPQAIWSVGPDPTRLPISGGQARIAVQPGGWDVRVEALGYAPEVRRIAVPAGGTAELSVVLHPEGG